MDFSAIRLPPHPIDDPLGDPAVVGPEASHLGRVYASTPRALIWHSPSGDWPRFVLVVPIATRLTLMSNPIFAQLVRDWGHQIRFIGIDSQRRAFDFRRLLSDQVLVRLVDALTQPGSDQALDILFAALAEGMLTMLERRRDDWPAHLARKHRLEPQAPDALYDRAGRFPDFLAGLRRALRDDLIDLDFYGRALRAIDSRELHAETTLSRLISAALDPTVLQRLDRLGAGRHLGCYNWLLLDTRHAEQRAYVLSRLGCFAQFFADTLLDASGDIAPAPLNRSGQWDAQAVPFASWLAQVVDSGQDRLVIGALAYRFGVAENTIRALWRRAPAALGTPPTWQLSGILRRLDALPERIWPTDPGGWDRLMCHAASPA